MGNLTQAHVNAVVADFKAQVLKRVGVRSFAVAAVCDRTIVNELSEYELEVLPAILEQGLKAPTVSELFGVKLSFKECIDDGLSN